MQALHARGIDAIDFWGRGDPPQRRCVPRGRRAAPRAARAPLPPVPRRRCRRPRGTCRETGRWRMRSAPPLSGSAPTARNRRPPRRSRGARRHLGGAPRSPAPRRAVQILGVDFRVVEELFPGREPLVLLAHEARHAHRAAARCAAGARRWAGAASPFSAKASSARTISASSAAPPTRSGWRARSPITCAGRPTTSSRSTACSATIRSCPPSKARWRRRATRSRCATAVRTSRCAATSRATSPSCPTAPARNGGGACAGSRGSAASTSSCLTEPDAVVAGLEELFALHHKRWSVEGGSDAIDSPALEEFHRRAGRALAERGWARLYLLSVGGAARAALYGWRHGDRFAFYQAGYDPDWRQRSVGTVLLGHVVEELLRRGVHRVRLSCAAAEAYKLKWANGWRETVRLRARDASLRALIHDAGRTAYWRLREAGKRALPPSPRSTGRVAPAGR